ncbi:MAG: transposase, partial [Puniceicoccales bacterium]|nr:transposase [Puniceicoccales bacterium]
MARQRRLKSNLPTAVYHCVTRTVNGEFLFDDSAKEVLRKQIHQVAQFCGVEIVTYAVMSNHFHVLVRVPEKGNISDAELLRR